MVIYIKIIKGQIPDNKSLQEKNLIIGLNSLRLKAKNIIFQERFLRDYEPCEKSRCQHKIKRSKSKNMPAFRV